MPGALWRRRLSGAALCLVLAACGGGNGSGPSSSSYVASLAAMSGPNVVPVTVEAGPGSNVNMPYVTVTVCIPGSNNCSTVDHVLLDTASTGLRLFASKVGAALPAHTLGGKEISECAHFLRTLAWGSVRLADVRIGGESAAAVPVHLMDAGFAPVPTADCGYSPLLSTSTSTANNTQSLSANGILGVGLFPNDGQIYFNCATPASTTCTLTPAVNQQVQNPVSLFAINNNGVVIRLPALPATGALRAEGYLVFGVGTQSNNQLGAAKVVAADSSGEFTTVYQNAHLTHSVMDSGSNGLFFDDGAMPLCSGTLADFYCPSATLNLSASIWLTPGGTSSTPVTFSIASADSLLAARSHFSFNNLGGTLGTDGFDWGLPFFFGRSVFTLIASRSVPGTALTGPLNAFTD